TPFDLRNGKRLEEGFDSTYSQNLIVGNGYDHYFLLNDTDQPNIVVEENKSGRILSITTDQPGVVMYTANGLEAGFNLNVHMVETQLTVCLQTQAPPFILHREGLTSIVLKSYDNNKNQTLFRFSYE